MLSPSLFRHQIIQQRQNILLLSSSFSNIDSVASEQKQKLRNLDTFLNNTLTRLTSAQFGKKLPTSLVEDVEILAQALNYIQRTATIHVTEEIRLVQTKLELVRIFLAASAQPIQLDVAERAISSVLNNFHWKTSSVDTLLMETQLEKLIGTGPQLEAVLFQTISKQVKLKISDRKQQLQFFLSCLNDDGINEFFADGLQECYDAIGKETNTNAKCLHEWIEELPTLFSLNPQATIDWLNSFFLHHRVTILCDKELFDSFLKFLLFLDGRTRIETILSNFASRIKIVIRQPSYKVTSVIQKVVAFILRFHDKDLAPMNMLADHIIESSDASIFSSFAEDFARLTCLRINSLGLQFSSDKFKFILQKFTFDERCLSLFLDGLMSTFAESKSQQWEHILAYVSEDYQLQILSLALDSILTSGRQVDSDFLVVRTCLRISCYVILG